MGIDAYRNGMQYENFICRAYKSSNNNRNGAHLSYMRNLINAENGETFVSHLPSVDKQMATIKMYIAKAFNKYLEYKLTEEEKELLLELKNQTTLSNISSELLRIIEEALILTDKLK